MFKNYDNDAPKYDIFYTAVYDVTAQSVVETSTALIIKQLLLKSVFECALGVSRYEKINKGYNVAKISMNAILPIDFTNGFGNYLTV